jgi:hypothetical protein
MKNRLATSQVLRDSDCIYSIKGNLMRALFLALASSLLLASCGGGGSSDSGNPTGSTGTTIPAGTVSGTSFDGLIINGTVSVYDFTTGSKGALIGQATTDSDGLYSISIKVESRPVLVELTGGYYIEEAGSVNNNVTLSSNHKLAAVANYLTGTPLKVAVTTYSYLATGLAQYQIAHGTAVATAINNANTRISSLAGVNILTTIPKEITDVKNASSTLTPELRYGFLAGAISMWTYTHAPSAGVAHQTPYSSIDFAQLLYKDILADGLLDGFGVDSTGAKAQLSFGTTPLGVDVYRFGLGTALVQMAGDGNNKTGLTGSQVLSFANAYIASTDGIFNNVAPVSFAPTTTAINSVGINGTGWADNAASVSATVQSPFGIGKVEAVVDGSVLDTSTITTSAQAFQLDTSLLTDGAHTLVVRTTDLGGFVTTATNTLNIDHTWPVTTSSPNADAFIWLAYNPSTIKAHLCFSDVGSGVTSFTNTSWNSNGSNVGTYVGNGCWEVYVMISNQSSGAPRVDVLQARDIVGHCTNYNVNAYYGGPVLISKTSCP